MLNAFCSTPLTSFKPLNKPGAVKCKHCKGTGINSVVTSMDGLKLVDCVGFAEVKGSYYAATVTGPALSVES